MRIFILLLITTSIFISCSDTNSDTAAEAAVAKTAVQLEDSSLKSRNRIDTLSRGFILGMTPEQVEQQCKKLEAEQTVARLNDGRIFYRFETKNFILSNAVEFYYYDNKLFRIVETTISSLNEPKNKSNANFKDEVLIDTKKNWGEAPKTNGTLKSKFFWLKGNLRIDYFEEENTSAVVISDIGMERQLIAFHEAESKKQQERENLKNDSILKDYYSKNKTEEANAVDEENQIIAKLKKKAARDWPEDYTTQEYWIKEQIAAYHYMQTIPQDDKIKKKAQRDWPLDFSTQKYWYNEQIEARERLK